MPRRTERETRRGRNQELQGEEVQELQELQNGIRIFASHESVVSS
jgi:hypothetical protein